MKKEKIVWSHPELGELTYDGICWIKKVRINEFKKFTYLNIRKKSDARVNLEFPSEDEKSFPSEDCISLVNKVLENQEKLVPKIANSLWDDFNGRNYNSGHWWHANLAEVLDYVEEPIDSPESIYSNLLLLTICCYPYHSTSQPVVELRFSASFEGEHGLGILTDGDLILGAGNSHDVYFWENEE